MLKHKILLEILPKYEPIVITWLINKLMSVGEWGLMSVGIWGKSRRSVISEQSLANCSLFIARSLMTSFDTETDLKSGS